MSSLTKIDDNWIPLQTKVFSRWVSSHLRHPNDQKVTDISKDLSNGVALVELATELTQKQPSRQWCDQPKRNVEMVQNCDLAIDMFTKDGVKLVGISGKDIYDNNQKLILGLVWTLILYYSIGKSVNHTNPIKTNAKENLGEISPRKIVEKEDHVKRELMAWAIDRTSNYPNIHDFHPFDLSLCALLDSYFPEKINYYTLNPSNIHHNSKLAIDVMEEVGIPIYVFPDELEKFNEDIDEKTLLTQLSAAKVILDQLPTKPVIHERDVLLDEKQDFDSDSNSESEVERLSKALEEIRAELHKSDEEKMKLAQALVQAEAEISNQKQANQKHESEIIKLSTQYKESQKSLQAENKLLHEALSDKEMELRSEKWEKSKVESEVSELSQTINEMKQKADAQKEDKAKANAEVEKLLKAANVDAENSRKNLENELKEVKTAKDKAESQLFSLTKQINSFKNEKELFAKSLKDIQEEKESAEKEVSRLTKLVKSSSKSGGDFEKQKQLEKELNDARLAKEKLESQIIALSKQIEDFKNEKELFAKSFRDIQEEKESAEREVSRLTKLTKTTPAVGGDVEGKRRLHNKLVLAEAGKERAVEELIELSKKLEDYETEKDLLTKTLRQVQEEKESAELEVDRLSRAVVEAEARNALLEKNLEESQNEVEQNKDSFNFSQANTNNISKAYDELQEVMDAKIQDLQGEIEWITAEKSEVEADAAVLAKALKEAGTDKEEAEEEVQRLSRAVVEAEAKIALLEREINLQKEANNSLQENITDLSQAYEGLKQEYEWTNEQKEEVEEDAHVLAYSLIKKENKVKQLSDDNYEAKKYALALTKVLSRARNEIGSQNHENKEDLFEQQQQPESNSNDTQSAYYEIQRSKELAQTYSNALDEALNELQKKSDENEQAKEEIRNLASELGEADYEVQRLTKAYQRTRGLIKQQNEQLNALSSAAEELEIEKSARMYAEQEIDKLNKELDQANDDIDTLNESLADTEIQRDKLKKSLKKSLMKNKNEKRATREAELQAENLAYSLAMKNASENRARNINNNNNNNENEEEVTSDFEGLPMEETNFRLAGRKFGLTMTIDGENYALTLVNPNDHFINSAGLKLDLAPANIENDVNQQFVFGKDAWNTVIDSVARQGMVWDVANADSWNPPNGTEFYLYPFHGRHNQHFVFKDNMIYAKQNGQVVTYVGYDFPFVMSEPTEALKENQTFNIQLI